MVHDGIFRGGWGRGLGGWWCGGWGGGYMISNWEIWANSVRFLESLWPWMKSTVSETSRVQWWFLSYQVGRKFVNECQKTIQFFTPFSPVRPAPFASLDSNSLSLNAASQYLDRSALARDQIFSRAVERCARKKKKKRIKQAFLSSDPVTVSQGRDQGIHCSRQWCPQTWQVWKQKQVEQFARDDQGWGPPPPPPPPCHTGRRSRCPLNRSAGWSGGRGDRLGWWEARHSHPGRLLTHTLNYW